MNNPIGIFDSGVGGLTVVREVMEQLPNENILYFGDTARVPYGSKSEEDIIRYSKQIMHFLASQNVKAVIIACNSISCVALEKLSDMFPIPIIDVINPGVSAALEVTRNNRIGVIGTEATIRNGAYGRLFEQKRPGVKVFSKACPLFVPMAEEGWTSNTVATLTAEIYLQGFWACDIDTLVLGCTHYPLFAGVIRNLLSYANIVDPAVATARKMMSFLTENNIARKELKPAHYEFYVSGNTAKFDEICNIVLNMKCSSVKVDIENVAHIEI